MAKTNGTLDVSALESWLWEAACTIRGPLDAPKLASQEQRAGNLR
jgi:hypothetical protein